MGHSVYRMRQLLTIAGAGVLAACAGHHPPAGQSPLTYLIVGLTFGYYIVYSIGLIIHAHDRIKQQNALPPGNSV